MISKVAWAVQPDQAALNRPTRLVSELVKLGAISSSTTFYHHGRTPSVGKSSNRGYVSPALTPDEANNCAVLSPLFRIPEKSTPAWIDYYDDWSLAPDINPLSRQISRLNYAKIRGRGQSAVATVNSRYMAFKLGLPLDSVVPNGLDPDLAELPLRGDDKYRLVILGKLFAGRTDLSLLEAISRLPWVDEIVFGGIGTDPRIKSAVERVKSENPGKVKIFKWIDSVELSQIAGTRTAGVVPHVVKDYTVSQDLMKVYSFLAAGIPVVCPHALWPPNVDKTFSFLLNPGVDLHSNLNQWMASASPSDDWRRAFALENSWHARARTVADRVLG